MKYKVIQVFAPFPNRCLANLGQAACRQISLNEVFHNGCTFKELLLFNMNQKKHKMRPETLSLLFLISTPPETQLIVHLLQKFLHGVTDSRERSLKHPFLVCIFSLYDLFLRRQVGHWYYSLYLALRTKFATS